MTRHIHYYHRRLHPSTNYINVYQDDEQHYMGQPWTTREIAKAVAALPNQRKTAKLAYRLVVRKKNG